MRCVPARAAQHDFLAVDKSGIKSWEHATVGERPIRMHLPDEEFTDTCGAGDNGVLQLLEHARTSLMSEAR